MIFCRVLFLIWMLLGLGMTLALDGQPKTGKHSFWISLISCVIQVLLLWGGGFFS